MLVKLQGNFFDGSRLHRKATDGGLTEIPEGTKLPKTAIVVHRDTVDAPEAPVKSREESLKDHDTERSASNATEKRLLKSQVVALEVAADKLDDAVGEAEEGSAKHVKLKAKAEAARKNFEAAALKLAELG